MKTKILICLLALAILGCSKDKFQTKPQISIKSFEPDVVPINSTLKIRMEFTDKEGDVDDSLWIIRQRLNRKSPVTMPASPYKIPDFPETSKGEFQITLRYQFDLVVGLSPIPIPGSGTPPKNEPDTMVLKFVARDQAGNKSDTISLNNLYILR